MPTQEPLEPQWRRLCDLLQAMAVRFANGNQRLGDRFGRQAEAFSRESKPHGNAEFLARFRQAGELLTQWQQEASQAAADQSESDRSPNNVVDEVGRESFPASDPPGWTSSGL